MRIITWNCNMAFRKKAAMILRYHPDILVIVECEHPDKLKLESDTIQATDKLWFGKNQNKGLAIFSYCNYRFQVHETHNEKFQMIIPIKVTGGAIDFYLFIVWAYNPEDKDGRYITQVWKAISHYKKLLDNKPVILIGDFNSNSIWDNEKYRLGSHSEVVKQLEDTEIFSTYHLHHKQQQGKEQHPTFYLYRHENKPYHLDYCFASLDLIKKLKSVEIGGYNSWAKFSDHVPVIVEFDTSDK